MLAPSFAALAFLSSLISFTTAQSDVHNVTGLSGTWSSGSGAVTTGPDFANPANFTFHYPKNTGIAYSFTDDGYFEQAEYRMKANGTQPNCIQGTVLWQHGKYQLLDNGSMILEPIAQDGRLQVQDPCAAQSNVLFQFNVTYLFLSWRIFSDPQRGPKLQLYQFDGAPKSPMFLIAQPPNMLPTNALTPNLTVGGDGTIGAARANLVKISSMMVLGASGVIAGAVLLL